MTHQLDVGVVFGVVTVVLLSPEPDLSIVDVDTQQTKTGTGRDTDRVPDSGAPGGKITEFIQQIREPQDSPVLPGKAESFLVKVCAASVHLITGPGFVAPCVSLKQQTNDGQLL